MHGRFRRHIMDDERLSPGTPQPEQPRHFTSFAQNRGDIDDLIFGEQESWKCSER
jgi:hypothetical protein